MTNQLRPTETRAGVPISRLSTQTQAGPLRAQALPGRWSKFGPKFYRWRESVAIGVEKAAIDLGRAGDASLTSSA